ncbi:MAG: TonB-dependent receptor plug domain-containing protein [Succinivibrio sp.]
MKKTALFALLLSTASFASEDNEKYLLINIEVSANRSVQSILKTTNTVDVVQRKEIEESGEDKIPLMLKKQPGITVQTDGTPGIYTVSIRGEQPSRTVLLTDGIKMSDQKSRQGMPFLYNPEFVKRIEIIRGAASVLYGSDAQSGIINTVSSDPDEKKFAADTAVSFNSQGNGFTESLNASGTIDRFGYVTSFMHTDMGDRYLSDRNRLDNTSYYQSGADGKFMYQLTDRLKIGTVLDFFDINARTATTTTDSDYADFKMHIPSWSYKKASIFTESYNLNSAVSEFKSVFYTGYEKKEFIQNTGPSNYSTNVSVNNKEKARGANISGKFEPSRVININAGYDVRQEICDGLTQSDMTSNPLARRGRAPLYSISENRDSRLDSHAIFSLFTLFPYERINIEYGVRWNHFTSKSGNIQSKTFFKNRPYAETDAQHNRKNSVRTVQSAGILYKLDYRTVLRGSYSEGFKVPGPSQLFMTSYSGRTIEPNTSLKPETSKNYELGVRFDGDSLTADADVFYTASKNYIDISRYSILPEKYRYRNVSKAQSFGLEMKLSYHADRFTPYLNLTAMRRKLTHENISSYDSGTPELFGSAGVRFDDRHSSGSYYADLYAIYSGGFTEDPDLGQNSLIKDDTRIAGYATFNLSVGTDICFSQDFSFKLFGLAGNIFDKKYRTSVYLEEPGRYFILGGKASF